jgi:predicted small secreted protein
MIEWNAKAEAKASGRTGAAVLIPLSFLLLLSAVALGGCNTVSGAGEDIAATGRAIDRGSQVTEQKVFNSDQQQQQQRNQTQ